MGFFKSVFKSITNFVKSDIVSRAIFVASGGNPVVQAILTVAVIAVGSAMAPKPRTRNSSLQQLSYQQEINNRAIMFKQPIIPRDVVYGETKKSGGILFVETSNNDKDLHLIVQIASHEIQSFESIFFNEEELTISSVGNDANGIPRYKVTSPTKFAKESRFTKKEQTLIATDYISVQVPKMAMGSTYYADEYGLAEGITTIKLINDASFTIAANDKLNIGGRDYTVNSGGTSSVANSRHELSVTISEALVRQVNAYSIRQHSPNGLVHVAYYNTPNRRTNVLPFESGQTTGLQSAVQVIHKFTDSSELTVRIKQHLGTDTQLADADLVNEVSGWTNDHRLQGIAYLYIKLKYDAEVFPNGIPNVSAKIRGKKLLDFRDSSTAFSSNPALVIYDYLSDSRFGLGVSTDDIDTTSFTTLANICDEDITLSGGGTENRYECHGVVYNDIAPMEVLDDLLSSCVGVLSYSNGKFKLAGGKYVAPSISLSEDDFRSGINITTKQSRRDTFNTVKGLFTSETANFQPTDYPMVSSSTFTDEDGETIFADVDLPFTKSSSMAQRIAKITLFKNRQQMVLRAGLKLTAFKLEVGDTVNISLDKFGFTNKIFEVADWSFVANENDIGIDVVLKETSSNVYDWDAEESTFSQDNTTLPTFQTVSTPSLAVSDFLRVSAGTVITVIQAVVESNQGTSNEFEVQYRNTNTDDTFKSLGKTTNNIFEIENVEDGAFYEIRAKSINAFNVSSDFISVDHEVIGKTAPPSDVSNFSVNIIDNQAICSWTAVDDLDISHYVIRHTPAITGQVYSGAELIADNISKATNVASLPAKTGTYMIKAVDVLGLASETSTKKVVILNQINEDFNVVSTQTESTGFAGTKTDCEVVTRDSTNFLQIILGELFDDGVGNFDDNTGNFDDGGFTPNNLDAIYEFQNNPIDLGGIYNSFVTVTMNSSRHDSQTLFDSFGGVFDDREGLFDGNYTEFDDVKAVIQISTSTDNSTYTDFQDYVLGYYKARYIKLRVKMETTNITSTPAISQLVATIDMPDRTIASDDVASGTASGGKAVSFSPAFKSLEGLGISADNLATGDFYEIVSKSETGFTIRFKNSSGSVVDRTFGFVAKGFGFLESS
jgi:hypothetical protein